MMGVDRTLPVITRLDPATHPLRNKMDARVKTAHDVSD